jgi:hypothetical protein
MRHSREDIEARLNATADLLLTDEEEIAHDHLFRLRGILLDDKMTQVVDLYMGILAEAMNREHVPQTKPKARKHKQQVELERARAKSDAYRSQYPKINLIDVTEAWRLATEIDGGIPKELPSDLTEDAKRAIVTLARLMAELRHEWS